MLSIRTIDDGVGGEAYSHEEMRRFRLILFLSVQDFGGKRQDG